MADGFEILGRVATTSSGAVWKARDRARERIVALKEIAPSGDGQEMRALAALRSIHIAGRYGLVEDGERVYLSEEWIEGATLAAVLRAGRLEDRQALGVMRGALLGLADAHRAGVVHGALSPSKILITTEGAAKLIDFGSASTAAFRAPEVTAGQAATPAADVYSAGAVLASLLHGRTDVQPSSDGIDEPVRTVVDRALSANVAARYTDAAAFLAALDSAAEQLHGVLWWTDAGLGALAASSIAVVEPVGAAAPFATVGAAASAEAPASPAAEKDRRPANRKVLIGTCIGVVVALGAIAAAVIAANSGGGHGSGHALSSASSSSVAAPSPASSSSSPAPSTVYFPDGHVTIAYTTIKNTPKSPLKHAGSVTVTTMSPNESFFQRSGVSGFGAHGRPGTALLVSGTLRPATYRFAPGSTDVFGALELRIPFVSAALNSSHSGGEVFTAGFGVKTPVPTMCTLVLAQADPNGIVGTLSCPRVSVGGGQAIAALKATFTFGR